MNDTHDAPPELAVHHDEGPTAGDRLRALPQYLAPQHALTAVVRTATRWRWRPWKTRLIRWFVRRYDVDMSDARHSDPFAYQDFNAFFTRALRPGTRPIPADPTALACPCDGAVSQLGALDADRIVQAKGHTFTAGELLGGDDRGAPFHGGRFATLYLSPRDYHRVHMPLAGVLQEMVHVPGRLFSVGPHTARAVPRLFARNERIACLFDTEAGPMAVVLVGAMLVACIETVWAGVVTPPRARRITARGYGGADPPVRLERGAELGRFNMGSTVIVLLGPQAGARWATALGPGTRIRVGQALGRIDLPAR